MNNTSANTTTNTTTNNTMLGKRSAPEASAPLPVETCRTPEGDGGPMRFESDRAPAAVVPPTATRPGSPPSSKKQKTQKRWLGIESLKRIPLSEDDTTEKRLYSISILNDNIDMAYAVRIAKVLRNRRIRRLRLSGNLLTDTELKPILTAIRQHPWLKVLNVSENLLTDKSVDGIAELLEDPRCRISELALGMNNIEVGGLARLMKALKGNTRLHTVDLSGNEHLFGKTSGRIKTLEKGAGGILHSLNFSDLHCKEDEMETLKKALESMNQEGGVLHSLNLSDIYCKEEQMETVLGCLGKNKKLVALDLSDNSLGFYEKSEKNALLGFIYTNKTLKTLMVNGCGLGRFFWKRLHHAMNSNLVLEHLGARETMLRPGTKSNIPMPDVRTIIKEIYQERSASSAKPAPLKIDIMTDNVAVTWESIDE